MHQLPADWTIDVVASCESTNSLLLDSTAAAPRVLLALEQTAGRGRRGRGWASRAGDSLTFSLKYVFDRRADALAGLSLAVGVVLAEALAARGFTGIGLKWPNDLMRTVDGVVGKLGGILIELSSSPGARTVAVIGVGINLAPPPADEYGHPPAALFAGTPERDRLLDLAGALVDALVIALPRFASDGFASFRDGWNARNLHAGCLVTVSGEHRTLQGRCAGADRDGALLLESGDRIERVLAGDVSLRALP